MEEVSTDWRKLHNEELHGFYTSVNTAIKIKGKEVDWRCGTYGREVKCIQKFGGNPKGKKTLGRPRLK